jgi:hypothetical protein
MCSSRDNDGVYREVLVHYPIYWLKAMDDRE